MNRPACPCRRVLMAAAVLTTWPALLHAEAITLLEAIAEHGGSSLRDMQSLVADSRLVDSWPHQSRRPGPPWDRATGSRQHVIDFSAERYAETSHWVASGNYPFHSLIVSDGADSYVANLDEGYWRRVEPEFETRILDFQLMLAPLVLRDASGRENDGIGAEGQDGYFRVPATLSGQAVELWIDGATRRLIRIERTLSNGARQVVEYEDYDRIGGILFNRVARVKYRGEPARVVHFRRLLPNARQADRFRRPPNLEEYVVTTNPAAREFDARQPAAGVWFIGEGVHYQLFVEFDTHVVAIGSVGGAQRRLEEVARRIPGKPVSHAVVSHHHRDHLEGLRALAEAGAVLLAAPTHEDILRTELQGLPFEIETVSDERVFSDGRRQLKILQIGPNRHADEMLAAYLPEERILFTADLFVQPPERPLRARIPPTRDLAIAIEAFGLDVDILLDPHSPRINTRRDLEAVLAR